MNTITNSEYIQALLDRIETQRRQLKQLADEIDSLRAKSTKTKGRPSAGSHAQAIFEEAIGLADVWAETRAKNMKLG